MTYLKDFARIELEIGLRESLNAKTPEQAAEMLGYLADFAKHYRDQAQEDADNQEPDDYVPCHKDDYRFHDERGS